MQRKEAKKKAHNKKEKRKKNANRKTHRNYMKAMHEKIS